MRRQAEPRSDLPTPHEQAYIFHTRIRTVAVVLTIVLVVFEIFLVSKIPGQPYSGIILNNVSVARVSRGSPAAVAGFRKGDLVTGFGGVRCGNLKDFSECLSRVLPGETVTYELLRNGRAMAIPLTFARPPRSEIVRKASLVTVGLSFVAIGLVVYFRRADKLALVFYLLCLAFGLVLMNIVNFEFGTARYASRTAFNDLLLLSLPALFLHFFLLFPEKSRFLPGRPRLEQLMYLPLVALFAVSVFFNIMTFLYGRSPGSALAAFQSVTAVYFIAFVILGLVAFVRAYRNLKTARVKRTMRHVVWGTLAGTLPIVVVRVILSIEPAIEVPGEKVVFLPLILVPLAFGHAIVRYGLLDLEIAFKRSLVYTFLLAVLASVYFAVVYGIGRLASRFIGRADLLFSIISIFVITLLISPLRQRISLAVDKAFFRHEYNYRKDLKQISRSLAGMINLESLASYLSLRVAGVLNASTTVVFLLDEKTDNYTARYGTRVNHAMVRGFSADGTLSKHLLATRNALNVERTIASRRPLPICRDEAGTLHDIQAALVVPFVFRSSLLGFMTIGRRMSEEFYLSTDVELLETLGDQVSLAVENARLYLEMIEKQKMEKDLELAREIQHRLLPKTFPKIPGLKTEAMNLPSKHVGGDYYDIISLCEDEVALVIADVSGKGVPAALLMASLQSSLRAEAAAGRPPSEVISVLNKEIFEHTAGGTFVTIFYGVMNLETETLTYCNAGQTPPVILGMDLETRLLDTTHLVIGIDNSAEYADTSVNLTTGDLIFLYTDGITDELDERDEPYGETRLLERLKELRVSELIDILNSIHDAVVEYTGGKPQDDLTALALRIEAFIPTSAPAAARNVQKAKKA
ncbi:MAG: SpoIIE family protein phosphatase [Candidatus Eisenbacteria bacterium]